MKASESVADGCGSIVSAKYLGACFEVGTGERTSTAPVYCSGWWAICCARKVSEWSEFVDLGRGEGGYALTLDFDWCSMDKPDKGEGKNRS